MLEVSWRLNKDCNILTPSSPVFSSTSFSFCWLLNREPGGPSSLRGLALTASNCSNWLQTLTATNWTSYHTGLYHCLTPTYFLWASYLHWIQPVHSQGYPFISSTGCTCSLIDCWVGGQYVTQSITILTWIDACHVFAAETFIFKTGECVSVLTLISC